MKLHIKNSIVIEMNGKTATLGCGEYEFDSVNEFIKFIEGLGEQPKQPLIKDEKIRKAVRAWAEVNRDVSQVMFSKDVTGKSYSYLTDTDSDAQIKFNFVIDGELDIYEVYTIAELCGEGEE